MYAKSFFAFAVFCPTAYAADAAPQQVMEDFVRAMLAGEAEHAVAHIHIPAQLPASGADTEALRKSLAACMAEMHKTLPPSREVVRIEIPEHNASDTQLEVPVTLALDGQAQTAPLPMVKSAAGWQVNYLPFAIQTCNVDIGDPVPVLQHYLDAAVQGDFQKALAMQYVAPQTLQGREEADYIREHEQALLQPLEKFRENIRTNKLSLRLDGKAAQYGGNHAHVKIPVVVQVDGVKADASPLYVQLVKTSRGWRVSPF